MSARATVSLRSLGVLGALAALVVLFVQPGGAQSASDGQPDVMLSMSVISLTERDDSTPVTVTAVLREVATSRTVIELAFSRALLLTPGVDRSAWLGIDYTAACSSRSITIAQGELSGTSRCRIDPTYDTLIEGDEAVTLIGETRAGHVVAPTDLIIEDGPYLSFPRYIQGSLHHPSEPIEVAVDAAVNRALPTSTVTYQLTGIEPEHNPLRLSFDPETRRLTGVAPDAEAVPAGGLTTRYTITARDSAGHEATTMFSVAVAHDVCSSTTTTWFHGSEHPPVELIDDCNVLLAARDTLRGSAPLNWATERDIATWHGVVEFHTDAKWLRKIDLRLRGMNGVIPPILGHLASPSSIDLLLGGDHRETHEALENKLTGPIPPELGLPTLVVLALSYNNLSGAIPRELANSGKLHTLYLYDTDKPGLASTDPEPTGVSGPIPTEFGDLALLRNLNISGNPGVSGHIPWQLGKNVSVGDHPGLQVLNLSGNNLEGEIPWQLGRFGKIQQLALSHNRLTGRIPWQLGNLGNEEASLAHRKVDLYLNGNQLTGPIPAELGGIANLTTLSLGENRLTSSIPERLGGLAKLRVLALRDNRLTGAIPPELGDLSRLEWLLLNNNHLSGQIPAELGRLSALQVLSVSCNDLSGRVPESIGAIETLAELSLYGNEALALGVGERPDNLQRDGLRTSWSGKCEPRLALTVTIEVRITAQRLADGRTEFALQRLGEDGEWSERILPARRFFPADPGVGRWLNSSPLTLRSPSADQGSHAAEVRITAQRLADGRTESALQRLGEDGEWSERILPARRFFPADPGVGRWLNSSPLEVVVPQLEPNQ